MRRIPKHLALGQDYVPPTKMLDPRIVITPDEPFDPRYDGQFLLNYGWGHAQLASTVSSRDLFSRNHRATQLQASSAPHPLFELLLSSCPRKAAQMEKSFFMNWSAMKTGSGNIRSAP